jgi:hypothetical protein
MLCVGVIQPICRSLERVRVPLEPSVAKIPNCACNWRERLRGIRTRCDLFKSWSIGWMTAQAIENSRGSIDRRASLGGGGLIQTCTAQLIGGSCNVGKHQKIREPCHYTSRSAGKPGEIVIDRARRASWIGDGFPPERLYRRHELGWNEHQLKVECTCDFHETRNLRIDG